MKEDTRPVMVTIRCITYNQERYIRECLEGFVMQKTNFRFEAIVHDDASTDSTADIIREYEEKYPDIIKPIYETENQYSKHDGSLRRILNEHTHGKYVAVCEGDDYWTDPQKLQKQFDFMESHPECSLCFHTHNELFPNGVLKECRPATKKSIYTIEDAIIGGGGFMATNSMFYRWELIRNEGKPDFWSNCPIGDFPSMLFLASKGNFGFFSEVMSVHRAGAIGSWTSGQNSYTKKNRHYKAILDMLDGFDAYTGYKYHGTILKKKRKNKVKHIKVFIHSLMNKLFCK